MDPIATEGFETMAAERAAAALDRQDKESRELVASERTEPLTIPSSETPSQEDLERWKSDHAMHQATDIARRRIAIEIGWSRRQRWGFALLCEC